MASAGGQGLELVDVVPASFQDNTGGGGAGSVIFTIEAGMRHVISAIDALGRADAQRIEVRQSRR